MATTGSNLSQDEKDERARVGRIEAEALSWKNILTTRLQINAAAKEEADFAKYDIILCGVDSMTFRKSLYEWSWKNPQSKTFWIDGRCTSRQGCLFNKTNAKAELETMLSDSQERTGCLHAFEKEQETAHTLPIIVAAMMVQTLLNYLRGDKPLASKNFMV